MTAPRDYLSVAQAAEALVMPARTIQRRIVAGTIVAEKLDPESRTSPYVIPRTEVERLKAERLAEVRATHEALSR